jgi:hypothetical protein
MLANMVTIAIATNPSVKILPALVVPFLRLTHQTTPIKINTAISTANEIHALAFSLTCA